jgi:hypothetical protein
MRAPWPDRTRRRSFVVIGDFVRSPDRACDIVGSLFFVCFLLDSVAAAEQFFAYSPPPYSGAAFIFCLNARH